MIKKEKKKNKTKQKIKQRITFKHQKNKHLQT